MIPTIPAQPGTPPYEAAERIAATLGAEYLEHYAVVPLRGADGDTMIATWREGADVQVVDDLADACGCRIARVVRGAEPDIRSAIRRLYSSKPESAEALIAGMASGASQPVAGELALDDLVTLANEAPVVRLVNMLLLEALESRASDVHLEGYAGGLSVRYRVDGVLQDAPSPPAGLTAAVVSRLKIMADLDIAERRIPQDGRIRLRLMDRQVDVRVSTLPTLHGESVVLRLLDKEKGRIGLRELGMAPETLKSFEQAVSRPHGIVLATGPTGSGKTTTLYAAIDLIRTGREKILTVEDPVEYQLNGVPQVPVNEKVGVTFATALRALLRQDPDVLFVGEIRDVETAEIATQASLTGHLVLSTLHTNDAAGALTRLLDLGVAGFLVASTVEAVLAQRLVRTICPRCRRDDDGDTTALRLLGVRDTSVRASRGAGCDYCRGSGYRGRTGIYELLLMSDPLRAALQERRGAGELRTIAIGEGMRTLRDDGVRLVTEGVTTPNEVLRVTRE